MAKDIRECLLEQVGKFHQWQEITYPGKTTEEIGGAWEVDYPAWNDIFDAFCHVLTQMDAETADSVLLDEMVYLIARDNEAEGFIQETTSHPQWFECLCRRAAASNENEAKWQFAAYLPECSCSQKVRDIILDFAKDPNEYVSRRALLAMPALRPDCVEQFAPLFWERNCYSPELQEYQRIAVLVSLDAIHSDLLPQYLEQAIKAGEALEAMGIHARIVNMSTIKPLDEELVLKCAKECGKIITCEEHSIIGGLGEAVCSYLAETYPVPVKRIGVNDRFGCSGTAAEVLKAYGLSAEHIVEVTKEFLSR